MKKSDEMKRNENVQTKRNAHYLYASKNKQFFAQFLRSFSISTADRLNLKFFRSFFFPSLFFNQSTIF